MLGYYNCSGFAAENLVAGYADHLAWEAGNVDESNPVENPEDWIWREDIGAWERK